MDHSERLEGELSAQQDAIRCRRPIRISGSHLWSEGEYEWVTNSDKKEPVTGYGILYLDAFDLETGKPLPDMTAIYRHKRSDL